MVKISAQSKSDLTQRGFISLILIGVGVMVLLIIFFSATGILKTNFRVSKNDRYQPEQQVAPPADSQKSESEESKSQPKSYSNKNEGLTLKYPSDWSIKENPNPSVIVAFGTPKEGSDDKFVDNVNVSISDLSSKPNITLNEVSDLWLKQTEADLPQGAFKLLEIKPTTLADTEAKRLVYTYSTQGQNIKGLVVITLKDKKAYIVTYTAEKNSYDKFLNDVKSLLDSININ